MTVIPYAMENTIAWNVPRSNGKHQEEDARREEVLTELGLRIVRFRNDEVVRNASQSAVVGKINELLKK
jgi:very-short-patch-repair endonuclease